jgi:hypothetical protein
VDLRAVTVDHQRRRAVGARLDGKGEKEEPGQPPVLSHRRDHRSDARDDRQDDAAGHDRTDERGLRQAAGAMTGEKPNETLVVAGKPMHPERDVRDEQARKDRQRCDNDEGDKDAADVCPERVARAGQRQSSPAALRVENGNHSGEVRSSSAGSRAAE